MKCLYRMFQLVQEAIERAQQGRCYSRGSGRGGRNPRRIDGQRIILSQTRAKTGDTVRGYV